MGRPRDHISDFRLGNRLSMLRFSFQKESPKRICDDRRQEKDDQIHRPILDVDNTSRGSRKSDRQTSLNVCPGFAKEKWEEAVIYVQLNMMAVPSFTWSR